MLDARDESAIPLSQSRLMAVEIPDAQFVALDSRIHILGAGEPAWQQFPDKIETLIDAWWKVGRGRYKERDWFVEP